MNHLPTISCQLDCYPSTIPQYNVGWTITHPSATISSQLDHNPPIHPSYLVSQTVWLVHPPSWPDCRCLLIYVVGQTFLWPPIYWSTGNNSSLQLITIDFTYCQLAHQQHYSVKWSAVSALPLLTSIMSHLLAHQPWQYWLDTLLVWSCWRGWLERMQYIWMALLYLMYVVWGDHQICILIWQLSHLKYFLLIISLLQLKPLKIFFQFYFFSSWIQPNSHSVLNSELKYLIHYFVICTKN